MSERSVFSKPFFWKKQYAVSKISLGSEECFVICAFMVASVFDNVDSSFLPYYPFKMLCIVSTALHFL